MRPGSFLILLLFVFTGSFAAPLPDKTDSLKQQLNTQLHDTTRLRILSSLASRLRHSGTSDALVYANEALALAEKLNIQEGKASVLQILGLIYNTRTDYKKSLFYSLQALRIYETLKMDDGKAFAYNALGLVYYSLKKYDLAESYFQKCLNLLIKLGLRNELSMIYCNIGNIYSARNNMQQSILYYKMGLENSMRCNDEKTVGRLLTNIGEVYFDLGNTDSARVYFVNALERTQKVKDQYTIAFLFFDLGKLELKENNLSKAGSRLLEAERLALKGSIDDLLIDIYTQLQELYSRKKDYERAFNYGRIYTRLKDSIYNENTVHQINEMQKVYEVEKRDKEIRLLSQQQQISEANLRNQRLIRNFALSGLVFVLVIIVMIARTMVLKQRVKNQVLSKQNAVAEKNIVKLNHENTLAKYEAMKSKTDPHFLFNSLTTLSSLVVEDPKLAVKYIKQFSQLFRMVLEIGDHKLITLEKEMEIVNSYIYLQKIRFEENLHVSIVLTPEVLHTFIPPFALQMIIENAVKHNIISNSNPFYLSVYLENNCIVIRNNLQKKMSKVPSTSTGQKSVWERYAILSDTQPEFIETKDEYIVKLPVLKKEDPITLKEYETA